MCGGLTFKIGDVSEEELLRFFTVEELAAFRALGHVETFFWARRPVLPAIIVLPLCKGESEGVDRSTLPNPPLQREGYSSDIHLYDWGNREKEVDLPKTGWARIESLAEGRWNHLHPKPIVIPAALGYEKKVWFDIWGSIEGVLVEKSGIIRAYMLTVPASTEYQTKTGHDRMPKLASGTFKFLES
jgi:hypothetical protein